MSHHSRNLYDADTLQAAIDASWDDVQEGDASPITKRWFDRLEPIAEAVGMKWRIGTSWNVDADGRRAVESPSNLAHELGHFVIAAKRRRYLPDFGLTLMHENSDRTERRYQREEEYASLIGIGLLCQTGQPFVWMLDEHMWLYLPSSARTAKRRLLKGLPLLTEKTAHELIHYLDQSKAPPMMKVST
jgi:hypothetical protein